jgi:hypothetical protein
MTLIMLSLIVGAAGAAVAVGAGGGVGPAGADDAAGAADVASGAVVVAFRLHPNSKIKPPISAVAAFAFDIGFLPSGAIVAGMRFRVGAAAQIH